jgi:hypothetical protein
MYANNMLPKRARCRIATATTMHKHHSVFFFAIEGVHGGQRTTRTQD